MEIKNLKYFAKGKRSKVYLGEFRGKKIVVKVGSRAKDQAKWLKLLNKYKIGPKFLLLEEDRLFCNFIDGVRIKDYLNKKNDKRVIKEVLKQCRVLDKLKIDKRELTNPYKHIIVNKKVVMIDFERCHYVKKAKNVTQFCEFLRRGKYLEIDVDVLKKYKKNQSEKNFKEIMKKIYIG